MADMTGALTTDGAAAAALRIMFLTVVVPLCTTGTGPTAALCTIMLEPMGSVEGVELHPLSACTARSMSRAISGDMISRILL